MSVRVTAPAVLVVAVGCLTAMLSGCNGRVAPVPLPPRPSAALTTEAATVAPPLTPRQQVVAAYTGYTAAMAAAFASRSVARVRQLLQPYLDPAAIRMAVRAFSRAWSKDEIAYGQVVQHIIGVRIQGTAAWVHDCDNTSGSGLEYSNTRQIVPGSVGVPDENIVTRLNLVHGRWMVWVQTIEDLSCAP